MSAERINYHECEPVMGFNSKQWWVYDNEHDLYIDPPSEVLDKLDEFDQEELQEQELANIIDSDPDWLQDSGYWYDEEDFEI